jgi:hypothetical protein
LEDKLETLDRQLVELAKRRRTTQDDLNRILEQLENESTTEKHINVNSSSTSSSTSSSVIEAVGPLVKVKGTRSASPEASEPLEVDESTQSKSKRNRRTKSDLRELDKKRLMAGHVKGENQAQTLRMKKMLETQYSPLKDKASSAEAESDAESEAPVTPPTKTRNKIAPKRTKIFEDDDTSSCSSDSQDDSDESYTPETAQV